jgi:hypothetical protein
MVLDMNVPGAIMKHYILKEIDATLIITIHKNGHQIYTQIANSNGFTT